MATFMTAAQLAERLPYTPRHINEYLKDRVFIEGMHYVRLPGSRKILYVWETIASDLIAGSTPSGIPMANGGVCHG
jgi:hypothetical protein